VLRGCLRVLIHGLTPTFHEHCSSLHQGKKQPDTKLLFWRILYVYLLFSEKGGRGEEQDIGERKRKRRGGRVVGTMIVVIIFLRLTSRSIFDNQENGLPYFTYVVAIISVNIFRLLELFKLSELYIFDLFWIFMVILITLSAVECFCISVAFLYFLGKYLFEGFENGLNVVLIQYLVDMVCCSFYVWENGKGSFACLILWWLCVEVHCLTVCLLIISFISFLSCPFFCKACFRWLNSVCKCSLSEMVKALCTNELIADCFVLGDDVTQHVSIYPYVLIFLYTWWLRVLSAFLVTRTSRKGNFFIFFYVHGKADIGMLIVEEIKNLRSSALSCLQITNVLFT